MGKSSKTKITVIGAGLVGSTIAYTLATREIASEILLIDINKDKAHGEAMDIQQGMAFQEPIHVCNGDYPDAVGSNIVVITSGAPRKKGMTRIDLAQTNVNIIKSIAPEISKYAPDAIYVLVSNPVDILTYIFSKISGIPENRVIGSGTVLDTARFRSYVSEHFDVAQKNVHGFVFGEHGDSSFIPWSSVSVAGVSVEDYANCPIGVAKGAEELDKEAVIEYVHHSGGRIIADKGATNYGVAASVSRLCRLILSPYGSLTTVSTVLHGEYGISDVAISILTEIGPKGVVGRMELPMTLTEKKKLIASADALKDVISKLDLDVEKKEQAPAAEKVPASEAVAEATTDKIEK